jgi:hypothetical protein
VADGGDGPGPSRTIPPVAPARISPEESFGGHPDAGRIHNAVCALLERIGPCTCRVTRSQVAFRRRVGSAYLWLPGRWLRRPSSAVVLSSVLRRPDSSPRVKKVAHPAEHLWAAHLEIRSVEDLDGEVEAWLREACGSAG